MMYAGREVTGLEPSQIIIALSWWFIKRGSTYVSQTTTGAIRTDMVGCCYGDVDGDDDDDEGRGSDGGDDDEGGGGDDDAVLAI